MLVPLAARMGDAGLAAQWRSFVESRGEGWTHFDGSVMAAAQNRSGLRARSAGAPDAGGDRPPRGARLVPSTPTSRPASPSPSRASGSSPASTATTTPPASTTPAAVAAAVASDDAAAIGLALEGAAAVAAADGEHERAAALLGAAGRVVGGGARRQPDPPWPTSTPSARPSAPALGDEAFERAVAAGARPARPASSPALTDPGGIGSGRPRARGQPPRADGQHGERRQHEQQRAGRRPPIEGRGEAGGGDGGDGEHGGRTGPAGRQPQRRRAPSPASPPPARWRRGRRAGTGR